MWVNWDDQAGFRLGSMSTNSKHRSLQFGPEPSVQLISLPGRQSETEQCVSVIKVHKPAPEIPRAASPRPRRFGAGR